MSQETRGLHKAKISSKGQSVSIANKVLAGGHLDDCEDLTVKGDVNTNYQLRPPHIEPDPDMRERVSLPQEYISMYDKGGYKVSEYKSIYEE